MRLYTRRFITAWGRSGGLALGGILFLIAVLQVLHRTTLLAEAGLSLSSFFLLIAYLLPCFVPLALPLSLLIALSLLWTREDDTGEAVALQSAGVGFTRRTTLLLPVLLAASLIVALCQHVVIPLSLQRIGALLSDSTASRFVALAKKDRAVDLGQGARLFLGPGRDNASFGDILFTLEQSEREQIVWAERGDFDAATQRLVLINGGMSERKGNEESSATFRVLRVPLGEYLTSAKLAGIFPPRERTTTWNLLAWLSRNESRRDAQAELLRRSLDVWALWCWAAVLFFLRGRSRLARFPASLLGLAFLFGLQSLSIRSGTALVSGGYASWNLVAGGLLLLFAVPPLIAYLQQKSRV